MRIIGKISGLEKELPHSVGIINKDNEEVVPYCNMKDKLCYESSYWGKCSNFELYNIKGDKNE